MSAIHAILFAGIASAAASTAFATLNPADKASIISISGSDLIASMLHTDSTTNRYYLIRSTQGKSSGKWYWESFIDQTNVSHCGIALVASTHSLDSTAYPGQSADSVGGPFTDAKFYKNAAGLSYANSFITNSVRLVRHKLDLDAGTYEVALEHGAFVSVATGLTGTQYPALYMVETSSAGSGSVGGTVNFGASAFRYQVPSGFKAGFYTGSDPSVQGAWADMTSWVYASTSAGWSGYTLRMRIAASLFPALSALRFQVKSAAATTIVTDFFVGKAASAGDNYDFDTTPTRVQYKGSSSISVLGNMSIITDPVTIALADTDELLMSIYYNTASSLPRPTSNPTGWSTWYKNGSDAATVNASGYTSQAFPVNIDKIEYIV